MNSTLSVYLDGDTIARLRAMAEARGVTLSSLLREATRDYVARAHHPGVGDGFIKPDTAASPAVPPA